MSDPTVTVPASDEAAPVGDEDRLRSAWGQFCDGLKALGDELLAQSPDDELDRAEAIRYLSRLTRSAFEQAFEAPSPEVGSIEPAYARRASIAQRNPDQVYWHAALSGAYQYRLAGTRGHGGVLSFITRSSGLTGSEAGVSGFLDDHDLVCEPDGTFAITISADRAPGNWLALEPGTDTLMVRELFPDPRGAVLTQLHMERIDGEGREASLTTDAVVQGLARARGTMSWLVQHFGDWTDKCLAQPNAFIDQEGLVSKDEILKTGGSPAIDYHFSYWELGPDEALVVEGYPEPADRWGLQLMNHWHENLNLPFSGSHLNGATARYEVDGSVRLVIAHRDPGVANWVDTDGHRHGVMLFRYLGVDGDRTPPTARVVAMSDVEPDGVGPDRDRWRQVAPGYLARRIG